MRIVTAAEHRRAILLRRVGRAATIGVTAAAIFTGVATAPHWIITDPAPAAAPAPVVGPLEIVDGRLVPVLEHIGRKP